MSSAEAVNMYMPAYGILCTCIAQIVYGVYVFVNGRPTQNDLGERSSCNLVLRSIKALAEYSVLSNTTTAATDRTYVRR